jgi:hypothetical protein
MIEQLVRGGVDDAPAAHGPRAALVTLDPARVETAVLPMRAAGVPPAFVVRWGDIRGYRAILSAQPPLVVLHAPGPWHTRRLVGYVEALGTLAPVVVFTEAPEDREAVLGAGAVAVADSPALIGDALGDAACLVRAPHRRVPHHGELFVVSWLLQRESPFCCHQLRRLLSPVNSTFPLSAVRSLLFATQPALHSIRRTLQETRLADGSIFSVVPIGAHPRS